ncbi:MAG: NAD(+)/NADH kinase [Christensenellales bacterium]|jgi:NAD+ kinase
MRIIGVHAHPKKPGALAIAKRLAAQASERGARAIFLGETAKALGMPEADLIEVEGIVAVGGDGTVLRAAGMAAQTGIPIIGVNLGRLGFLSEVEPEETGECLDRLIADDYDIEERMMLRGVLDGPEPGSWLALNDFVVFKGDPSRLTEIEVFVNGQSADRYPCDGVVIATATGSTAYSLSAGGPIMLPSAGGILITPLSPHKIGPRPTLIGENDEVSVRTFGKNGFCSISCDGRSGYPQFIPGTSLTVKRAEETTKLIRLKPYKFFDLIKQKLY